MNSMYSTLLKLTTSYLFTQFGVSVRDNVIRKKVQPLPGSVLYCDLVLGTAEHSGVYVGDNAIVHLDGSGRVECVAADKFLQRLYGFNTALSVYVSCQGLNAVGSDAVATRARNMVGRRLHYNVLRNNCHRFTSGCLSGQFDNADSFLHLLKSRARAELGADTWRVWGSARRTWPLEARIRRRRDVARYPSDDNLAARDPADPA